MRIRVKPFCLSVMGGWVPRVKVSIYREDDTEVFIWTWYIKFSTYKDAAEYGFKEARKRLTKVCY